MTGCDYRDIPIIINSFNRLDSLRRLVAWCHSAGQRRIIVIDNASTYPPLLEYLREIEAAGRASVVHLGANVGHLALWECGLLERLGLETEFVYTDPDVIPCESCPLDAVERMQRCPQQGKGAALVLPSCNIAAMNLHLVDLTTAVEPGNHAAVLLDQAGWHTSDRLAVPTDITPVPLPAKCPELNAAGKLRQFLRDNWLSNRLCRS